MKECHWNRRAATRYARVALSDHQLKDIGLSRFGLEFAVRGTVCQFAAIQPPASRRRWWKAQARSGGALVVASVLPIALGLTLILVIASAVSFYLVDVPIVDMLLGKVSPASGTTRLRHEAVPVMKI